MTSKIYYIYHIPEVKIGCTEKDVTHRVKKQHYTVFEVLETHTDIFIASDREIALQIEYGYPVDTKPYWQTVRDLNTPYAIAKKRAAITGRTLSQEHKVKLSAALTGKERGPQSPEHKTKLSVAQKGKKLGPLSPEHKAKISVAQKGKKQTPEHKAKRSAAMTGKTPSPETLAKRSASQKLRWERYRQQKLK